MKIARYTLFSAEGTQIEPTMVLHVDDDCDIRLYNLD